MRRKRHSRDQLDVFGYRPDDEPVPYVPTLPPVRIEPERPVPPPYRPRIVRKALGILPAGAPSIPLPPTTTEGPYEVFLDIEPEYDVELCIVHPRGHVTHRRRVLVTDKEIEWHVAALFSEVSARLGMRIVASDRTRGIRWVLTYDRKGEWGCIVKPCKTSSPYRKSMLS